MLDGEAAECMTLKICPIERRNGTVCFLDRAHLDKSKSSRLAGMLIREHLRGIHGAM